MVGDLAPLLGAAAVEAFPAWETLPFERVSPNIETMGRRLRVMWRLRSGDPARTAVEGYPGLLAFELVGRRSYKNSPEADRLITRKDIVDALEQGRTRLGLRLKLSHSQREALVDDASGDRLDAVMCLLQAGWASVQPGAGLPPDVDPVEGWIATAPA